MLFWEKVYQLDWISSGSGHVTDFCFIVMNLGKCKHPRYSAPVDFLLHGGVAFVSNFDSLSFVFQNDDIYQMSSEETALWDHGLFH
jgi:hypothetical protein